MQNKTQHMCRQRSLRCVRNSNVQRSSQHNGMGKKYVWIHFEMFVDVWRTYDGARFDRNGKTMKKEIRTQTTRAEPSWMSTITMYKRNNYIFYFWHSVIRSFSVFRARSLIYKTYAEWIIIITVVASGWRVGKWRTYAKFTSSRDDEIWLFRRK